MGLVLLAEVFKIVAQLMLVESTNMTKATFTHARGGCGAEAGGFWHSRSATAGMFTHTRSGRGPICHFLRTMMVWSVRFRSGRGKLGVGPISCGADFAPAPPPLRDRACVNTCNDLCWSQFSTRVLPRMCERTYRFWYNINCFRIPCIKQCQRELKSTKIKLQHTTLLTCENKVSHADDSPAENEIPNTFMSWKLKAEINIIVEISSFYM